MTEPLKVSDKIDELLTDVVLRQAFPDGHAHLDFCDIRGVARRIAPYLSPDGYCERTLEAAECGAVSEDAIKHLAIRSQLNRAIYKAVRGYRMLNMHDADDPHLAYPLVDLMSNPAPADIGTGEMEMISLVDEIEAALRSSPTASGAVREGGMLDLNFGGSESFWEEKVETRNFAEQPAAPDVVELRLRHAINVAIGRADDTCRLADDPRATTLMLAQAAEAATVAQPLRDAIAALASPSPADREEGRA